MITKRETSACVTNNLSLEHFYENLQDSMLNSLRSQASMGTLHPKEER
jgi:hypothetical protein